MSTKLQAVNRLLSRIGARSLDSLDGTLNRDHLAALQEIESTLRTFLYESWYFNTDRDVTLTPNADGEILSPTGLLEYRIKRTGSIDPRDFTLRSGKFYKTKEQSFEFTSGLSFDRLIYLLEFDELPPIAREYVAIRATRQFAFNKIRDRALSEPGREEIDFRAQLMRAQLEHDKPSMFRDPNVREAAGEQY